MNHSLTNVVFCFVLCFRGSDHSLEFMSALQGETIVLEYILNATSVEWYGPARDDTDIRLVDEIDMYNQSRKWKISKYSEDANIKNSLSHKTRLNIVGNNTIGEFFLKITNVSANDAGLYRCHIFTNIMGTATNVINSFILQLKYIANLSITYEPSMPIFEGSPLRVCCFSDSRLSNETVYWFNKTLSQQDRHNQSTVCLQFKKTSRYDSGIHTCKSEHEGQHGTAYANLRVLYPPSVIQKNQSFTPSDSMRTIRCITDGDPRNYTYGNWEHMSFFNEHIRFIYQNTEILILPKQEKRNRYQDSGIYVCSVSNGLPDIQGDHFQNGHSFVFSNAPPVVVKENRRIQYGENGQQMDLKVNVYSLSNITCQYIATNDGQVIPHEAENNIITTSTDFYGKQITVNGRQIVFRFIILTTNQFKTYTVTLCNEYGNVSYVTEIRSKGHEIEKTKTTVIAVTVCAIVLAVIVIVVAKRLVRSRKRNDSLNVEDVVQATEGQNNQMISTEARSIVEQRNTSIVSGERHLAFQDNDRETLDQSIATSSDNDSHTSEHLDDGYERPYTTLMAHNYVEDEHAYNNTTHNSLNDTSTPFPIVACKPIVGITKPYASQDNKNAHFCADDGQENIVRNTGEYINLSLKQ